MIVVLAHPGDHGALFLVDRWARLGARLLQPRDLSTAGWRASVGEVDAGWMVIGGQRLPTNEVRAVVTRLPQVAEQDLLHIAAPDRGYIAAEMNAFLIAWLSALRCPVFNRPSASSLMGPSLSHERWLMLARRAGLKLASPRYAVPDAQRPEHTATVVVVGDRGIGASDVAVTRAVTLARAAGAELLTVRFSGPEDDPDFASADLYIEPTTDIADLIEERVR